MADLAEDLAADLGGEGFVGPAPDFPNVDEGPDGLTDDQRVGALTKYEDHCAAGLGRLLQQYRDDKPNLHGMLCAFLAPMDELETALCDLLEKRSLETAEGVQLDILGELIGEPRRGRDDDTYRLFLSVRVLVNDSDGRREQLLQILRLIMPADTGISIRVRHAPPAGVIYSIVTTSAPISTPELAALLNDAKGAGILLDLITTNNSTEPAETFGVRTTTDINTPGRGWGSATTPGLGGKMASATRTGT